jgi:hypothetical protein
MTISPNVVRSVLASVVAVVFLWVSITGVIAGRDLARSRATVERAESLKMGLAYFYSDQDRYPSELEYLDGEKMKVYLSGFPGKVFTHKKWCQDEPRFSSRGGSAFKYEFCLARGWQGLGRGWHSIDERIK